MEIIGLDLHKRESQPFRHHLVTCGAHHASLNCPSGRFEAVNIVVMTRHVTTDLS
jgi:hypothetical protein